VSALKSGDLGCRSLRWNLEKSLTAAGWHVERGSSNVFAVRRSDPRWELIQVLVDTSHSNDFHGSVIDVGIGSRTA